MKRLAIAALALLTVTVAHADTFHYACQSGEARYSLTVNAGRHIVKLLAKTPPYPLTTFRILREATAECGKFGWILNGGATFCTATKGAGTLDWHGPELDCDQADTE